jgi:hypothetical protein
VILRYNVDQRDYLHWNHYLWRNSPAAKSHRSRFINGWRVSCAVFGIAIAAIYPVWMGIAIACAAAVAVAWYMPHWYDKKAQLAIKQSVDELRNDSYGRHQLELTSEGMRETTPVTESFVKWSGVKDVVREEGYIIVRLTNAQAAIINRESFKGPVPFDDLPGVIEEFMKKRGGIGSS